MTSPPDARAPQAPPPARWRVVLVDDHAIVREGYRRLLDGEPDLEVVGEHADAESAYAALQRLEADGATLPQVVVMDLSMPGRGGLDATRRVSLRWPSVRVLVFTMHDHPAMVGHALEAGAAGYITKTTAPQRLVDAIRRVAAGESPVLSPDVEAARRAPQARPPHDALTRREFDVLRLLVEGASVEQAAARLGVSAKTVANVQSQVRAKLGVASAVGLVTYALRHRLFDPGGAAGAADVAGRDSA